MLLNIQTSIPNLRRFHNFSPIEVVFITITQTSLVLQDNFLYYKHRKKNETWLIAFFILNKTKLNSNIYSQPLNSNFVRKQIWIIKAFWQAFPWWYRHFITTNGCWENWNSVMFCVHITSHSECGMTRDLTAHHRSVKLSLHLTINVYHECVVLTVIAND